jgi:hypothetical protein
VPEKFSVQAALNEQVWTSGVGSYKSDISGSILCRRAMEHGIRDGVTDRIQVVDFFLDSQVGQTIQVWGFGDSTYTRNK